MNNEIIINWSAIPAIFQPEHDGLRQLQVETSVNEKNDGDGKTEIIL